MITAKEKAFFLDHGYLCVEGVLAGEHLARVQEAFERIWEAEGGRQVSQSKILKYPAFLELIEHPPILERLCAIFGQQVQLLQADLVRQEPGSQSSDRYWHRDFRFPGERPLTINALLFIDDMTAEKGPTRVIPGSHRGEAWPSKATAHEPMAGEVAVSCPAGSAIFINGALWHSGGRNVSEGPRRGIFLYYGYWWLKRFDGTDGGVHDVPWQALAGASAQRLELLGVKMPEGYLEI